MTVQDLVNVLLATIHQNGRSVEVRIAHPVEGPGFHQAVGEVRAIPNNGGGVRALVICATEDPLWDTAEEDALPVVWQPPPPSSGV